MAIAWAALSHRARYPEGLRRTFSILFYRRIGNIGPGFDYRRNRVGHTQSFLKL